MKLLFLINNNDNSFNNNNNNYNNNYNDYNIIILILYL